MLPSGESKTYQQNVTMTMATITVTYFKQQLNSAVMDDLVESMQIKNKLVTLRSKMTLADRTFAIRQILKGLENENTPLSDYNIQSSVASLLEYISKDTESLMSDAQIVTVAAKLFQQITIGENKDINRGRYSRFGRAATFSLYNFANSLFQKDFSNVIGGGNSSALTSL
jgi:arginine deiminase